MGEEGPPFHLVLPGMGWEGWARKGGRPSSLLVHTWSVTIKYSGDC